MEKDPKYPFKKLEATERKKHQKVSKHQKYQEVSKRQE